MVTINGLNCTLFIKFLFSGFCCFHDLKVQDEWPIRLQFHSTGQSLLPLLYLSLLILAFMGGGAASFTVIKYCGFYSKPTKPLTLLGQLFLFFHKVSIHQPGLKGSDNTASDKKGRVSLFSFVQWNLPFFFTLLYSLEAHAINFSKLNLNLNTNQSVQSCKHESSARSFSMN